MSEAAVAPAPGCPICGRMSVFVDGWSKASTMERMVRALPGCALPPPVPDYDGLARCSGCELEFASPLREPGPDFYEWLRMSGFDYPRERWEWGASLEHIRKLHQGNPLRTRVLDVGCGNGDYLRLLSEQDGVHAVGLDHSPSAVETCNLLGLEALCGSVSEVGRRYESDFDVVTLWHVVEHVADPVGLLETSRALLAPSGSICFSLPLTPMSYEAAWPDPFNEPPHHLTRWNASSLQALASRLGLKLELILPKAESVFSRTAKSLLLQAAPPFRQASRPVKLALLSGWVVRHPWMAVVELWGQVRRTRLRGNAMPDVALVLLRNIGAST